MKKNLSGFFFSIGLLLTFCAAARTNRSWNISGFGAVGDGVQLNTSAIQRAIDTCKAGDTVFVSHGVFVSGTLYLRSGIILHVAEGAVLKGSPYFNDYPVNQVQYKNAFTHAPDGSLITSRAFLFVEDGSDITLMGKGTIDGSGDAAAFNLGNDSDDPQSKLRPCMLLFIHSRNIRVYDLKLMNSAYWLQNYIGCDNLHLRGLTIYNHTNYNQDGIDVDARNVLIEDCKIDVDDDGICFKSHERKNIVENVVVRNCSIASNCNAIKFGTVSMGGFKKVNISHCTIQKASADHIRHWQQTLQFIEQPVTVLSGIALESVDGAAIDGVSISDITMKDVQTPIFIVLGNKSRKPVGDTAYQKGQIKNIRISRITATSHSKMPSSITAYPGAYVENVVLDSIRINGMGDGTFTDAAINLSENESAYPENRMYGLVYPASGFYFRHVKNVRLQNATLSTRKDDARPVIVLDDVANIVITQLAAKSPVGKAPFIRVAGSRAVTIVNPLVKEEKNPFISLERTDERELHVQRFKKYSGWLQYTSPVTGK